MAAALWVRRRVLDESLSSKEKFAHPRGFGQAGLRFDEILRDCVTTDGPKRVRVVVEECLQGPSASSHPEICIRNAVSSTPRTPPRHRPLHMKAGMQK